MMVTDEQRERRSLIDHIEYLLEGPLPGEPQVPYRPNTQKRYRGPRTDNGHVGKYDTHPSLVVSAAAFGIPERDWRKRSFVLEEWLRKARQPHSFSGSNSNCRTCWGWYDDPRHR